MRALRELDNFYKELHRGLNKDILDSATASDGKFCKDELEVQLATLADIAREREAISAALEALNKVREVLPGLKFGQPQY